MDEYSVYNAPEGEHVATVGIDPEVKEMYSTVANSSNPKENHMSDEKVVINNEVKAPQDRGGNGGGLDAMAAIAALGARNGGNGNMGGDGLLGGGGGALGLVALMALMNGGDRFGRGRDDGAAPVVTPALIVAQQGIQQLLQGQGEIKLAGAQETSQIQQTLGQLALGVQQGFAVTGDKIQAVGLAQLAATAGVKDAVQNSLTVLLQAINNDGEKTRAQAGEINTSNLNRLLTVADLDRRDERTRADIQLSRSQASNDINIVNTNTANATAVAVARDEEARFRRLEALIIQANQTAIATNANLNIGNTGAVTNAAQTASPVNVRA